MGILENAFSSEMSGILEPCGKQIPPVLRRNEVELAALQEGGFAPPVFDGSPLPPFMRSVARQKQSRFDHRGTFPRRH